MLDDQVDSRESEDPPRPLPVDPILASIVSPSCRQVEDTAAETGPSSSFSADEKSVRILKGVRPGQNIRPTGHDITKGTTVLHAGDRIEAAEVSRGLCDVDEGRWKSVFVEGYDDIADPLGGVSALWCVDSNVIGGVIGSLFPAGGSEWRTREPRLGLCRGCVSRGSPYPIADGALDGRSLHREDARETSDEYEAIHSS